MATCLCDAIFCDAAHDAVKVLKRFVEKVEFPLNQTCCGQPVFNSGDFESARKVIRHTIRAFSGNDYPIIVPSASCAAMLFHSAKIAFRDSSENERAEVDAFALRIWEFCDYLVNALGVEKLGGKFVGKVAVHNSCHGKGSGTPEALKKLLTSIEGVELLEFDGSKDCCGFGGTFSVSFPEISAELGEAKVRKIAAVNPDIIVSADTSCLLHQKSRADKLGLDYPVKAASQVFWAALNKGGLS